MSFDLLLLIISTGLLAVIVAARVSCIACVRLHRRSSSSAPCVRLHNNKESLEFQCVRFASDSRFRSWLKFVPWDATGTLRLTSENILFEGQGDRGRNVRLSFPRGACRVHYLPNNFFRDGGVSWLFIEDGLHRYYFTAESEHFTYFDAASATGMYEAVVPDASDEVTLLKANS